MSLSFRRRSAQTRVGGSCFPRMFRDRALVVDDQSLRSNRSRGIEGFDLSAGQPHVAVPEEVAVLILSGDRALAIDPKSESIDRSFRIEGRE